MMLTNEQLIIRLVLAALLGSVVGLERERREWAAGLRTHMLVSAGASLFMIVSSFGFMDIIAHSNVSLDPSRVAAGVASGIGFLGAGTIMFRRDMIQGLTTAASLWAVAAIGLATGGGLYTAAVVTTLLVLAILAWVKPIERRVFQNRRHRSLKLQIERDASLGEIEAMIANFDGLLKHMILEPLASSKHYQLELILTRVPQERLLSLIEALRAISGVSDVSYTPV